MVKMFRVCIVLDYSSKYKYNKKYSLFKISKNVDLKKIIASHFWNNTIKITITDA